MKLKETEKSRKLREVARELETEESLWAREKSNIMRKFTIRQEKRALVRSLLPKASTTKFLMWFLFLNCTIIEVFTMWVTVKEFELAYINPSYTPDFTPLITLISTVVSEVVAFAVYALKSLKENTSGGIVYEAALKSLEDEAQG